MLFPDLLILLAWVIVPEGRLIEHQLGASTALPSAWAEPVVERASIVFHNRGDWAMAFFVAASTSGAASESVTASELVAASTSAVSAPQIYLFAPYFLSTDGLADLASLPVDVAEYYLHALLDARLDLEQSGSDQAWQQWVKERADLLMADVPESQRRSAYLAAVSDFGAHILSLANEVVRLQHRQRLQGRDVCRSVGHPASLFGLWERSFAVGAFAGHYSTPQGSSSLAWTGLLERRDKIALVRHVLGLEWSGTAGIDFSMFCGRETAD